MFKSHRFAVGLVYLNKSPTLCSYDNAFRVSGVWQLTNTGPLVMKNFPVLCLFISAVMMARRFYTPGDVNCTNLPILAARRMLLF